MSEEPAAPEQQELRNTLYRKVTHTRRRLTRGRMLVYRIAVVVAWQLVRFFWATCRVQATPGLERARATVRESGSVIPVYWHQHLLFGVRALLDLREDGLKIGFLVSPSVDGTAPAMLVAKVTSNVGQFYGSGPDFGGMSGVVYGLLGYVWLRGKFDPASGMFLHPSTVTMMLGWFFACLFNIIPNVANWTHGVGLAVGLAWGYLSASRAPLMRR